MYFQKVLNIYYLLNTSHSMLWELNSVNQEVEDECTVQF